MPERLKENASIADQLKTLARLAVLIDNDPRPAIDVITSHLNFSSTQLRSFMTEYRRNKSGGDDPLEV